ncbi:MAG: hypothetical protein Q4G25_08235 [Paracoccus sp. (in: a-proteobacteria)]|nr:hypothetical protein [Paracoccus sp. (in: a-proteobacteria)]
MSRMSWITFAGGVMIFAAVQLLAYGLVATQAAGVRAGNMPAPFL